MDERLEKARALLDRHGLQHARLDAAGFAGDIAAIAAPLARLRAVRALSEPLKALGFRYVAIELSPEPGAAGEPA